MKRFIAILMVLLMIPLYCFAANSPTVEKMIFTEATLRFMLAEKTEEWPHILERIKELKLKDCEMVDALYICLDKEYELVEWNLMQVFSKEDKPFVLIINSEAIVSQEVSVTDDGAVIVDFTDFDPNNYFICFYITTGAD